MHPPTVIVVHPRERRSKCTVEPLRGRDDVLFVTFPSHVPVPLDSYVRLGLGGPMLDPARDADSGLLLLDGTWRLADRMEKFFSHVPVRTLPAMTTAYPRRSMLFEDPAAGLATVEALYAALRILQRPTAGILDHYHWREEFRNRNDWSREITAPQDGRAP